MKLPAFFGGIRGKLITIFVLIKVLPLVLLAWFACNLAKRFRSRRAAWRIQC